MKAIVKVALLCAALISMPVMAEKIAVLGVQEALLASQAAKAFREQMKKNLSGDAKQVAALEKEAKAARDKLKKNRDLASREELEKMQLQFQKVFTEFQKRAQLLQQKQTQQEQAFLKQMKPKLDKVIRGLIEKEGYDVVVAKQATLYAAKKVDITARVVKLLDKAQ
ncbi:MAG: OmpH family outer membrane protein [Marinobacterium sp.]|nr:OmpH family outer membrane protein [Marinobacterium sp.]